MICRRGLCGTAGRVKKTRGPSEVKNSRVAGVCVVGGEGDGEGRDILSRDIRFFFCFEIVNIISRRRKYTLLFRPSPTKVINVLNQIIVSIEITDVNLI